MAHSQLKTAPRGTKNQVDGETLAQIKRLLGEVYRLTDAVAAGGGPILFGKPGKSPPMTLSRSKGAALANRLVLAKFLLALRRARTRFLDAELFGEPAWDILLDLYVAHCEARAVTVSSAALAAAVPQTTGLRWVTLLSDTGRVCRHPSTDDGRMVFVSLSETAREAMDAYLDWVIAHALVEAAPDFGNDE